MTEMENTNSIGDDATIELVEVRLKALDTALEPYLIEPGGPHGDIRENLQILMKSSDKRTRARLLHSIESLPIKTGSVLKKWLATTLQSSATLTQKLRKSEKLEFQALTLIPGGKSDKIRIYLPRNIEMIADDALLVSLINFETSLNVELQFEEALEINWKSSCEIGWTNFIGGFIQEASSSLPVTRISIGKEATDHQKGIAAARIEKVLYYFDKNGVPIKYSRMDPVLHGRAKRDAKPYLNLQVARNLGKDDQSDLVVLFLRKLVRCILDKHTEVALGKSQVADFGQFWQLQKRVYKLKTVKDTKTKKKGRKPDVEVSYERKTATKPSQLVGSFAWEKAYIKSQFDKAFFEETEFRDRFEANLKTEEHPITWNWSKLESEAQSIVGRQWQAKTKVLTLLKKRNKRLLGERFDQLSLKDALKEIREITSRWSTLSSASRNVNAEQWRLLDPISTFDTGQKIKVCVQEGEYEDFSSLRSLAANPTSLKSFNSDLYNLVTDYRGLNSSQLENSSRKGGP
jgi:hypothetical protein